MKAFTTLIVVGCLLGAAPLVQACGMKQCGGSCGSYMKGMDKNGDDAISKQEFDAFHEDHFKELDSNKDGSISKDEMSALHDKMPGKGMMKFDDRFDEVDINHDAVLSKDEAEIGMPTVFMHFDEYDTDKSGKISKEEMTSGMKKMHEKMRGNQGEGMMKPTQK